MPRNTRNSELSTLVKNSPCWTTPKMIGAQSCTYHRAIATGQQRTADDDANDCFEFLHDAAIRGCRAEFDDLRYAEQRCANCGDDEHEDFNSSDRDTDVAGCLRITASGIDPVAELGSGQHPLAHQHEDNCPDNQHGDAVNHRLAGTGAARERGDDPLLT